MKTVILAVALAVAGCGHDKPPPAQTATEPIAHANPAPQQVSPNVGIGGDIIATCKIQFQNPKEAPKFDFDSSQLLQEDINVLDQVAVCFTTGPLKGKSLALVGRADPRGPEQYNMVLGAKRAHNVTDYLEQHGVPPVRVKETSRGSLDATGHDEDTWRQDRRVDLVLGS